MQKKRLISQVLIIFHLYACLLASKALAVQDLQLPDLGDASSSIISTQQEYQLGRKILRSLRRQAPTIDDPLLKDYLETLGYKLAATSQLENPDLEFVIIESPVLNAFVLPGGVIAVYAGLFEQAKKEAEIASVLAHELAHASQRHYARRVEQQKRNRIPMLAGVLASMIIMATSRGENRMSGLATLEAITKDAELRFTRKHEKEADRVGLINLANAGYNPMAMPNMFERMLKLSRQQIRPPEFLLSHPLHESRVADTRNRAEKYPINPIYEESREYQLMRQRIKVRMSNNSKKTLQLFRGEFDKTGGIAARYGLALALTKQDQAAAALQILSPLLNDDPLRITYIVTKINILNKAGQYKEARLLAEKHLSLSPNNYPLTMGLAQTFINEENYQAAEKLLLRYSYKRPTDHHLWYQLAEVHGKANNIVALHQARAEYFILTGNTLSAREQLQYALMLNNDFQRNSKIRKRLSDIEKMLPKKYREQAKRSPPDSRRRAPQHYNTVFKLN